VDAQNAALTGGSPGEALVKREAGAQGNGVFAAHGKGGLQKLRLLVPEHDAEHVVVDNFPDALGNAAKKFLTVENGGQLAADFVKQGKGFRLLGVGDKQTLGNRVGIAQQSKRPEV
jgi:hypothetical protein